MIRNALARTAPLLAALVLGAPALTAAQGTVAIDFRSSMSTMCLNVGCTQLRFELNIPSPQFVAQGKQNNQVVPGGTFSFTDLRSIALLSDGPAFSSVLQIFDGANVHYPGGTWSAAIFNGNLELLASANAPPFGQVPFFVDVEMAANARFASFDYTGSGRADEVGGMERRAEFSVAGNTGVVPEPISMALLGTGLAGVGAVRRRRRNAENA